MPLVSFAALPDDARLWVFGSSDPLNADGETDLLASVDAWLEQWTAHGQPLTCAREWHLGRFLVVGVDQRSAGASGCSVDALYRVLQRLEGMLGTTFLGGDRVFYRDAEGQLTCADRRSFASAPGLTDATTVFDTTVTSARDFRERFEVPLGESWHASLRARR